MNYQVKLLMLTLALMACESVMVCGRVVITDKPSPKGSVQQLFFVHNEK